MKVTNAHWYGGSDKLPPNSLLIDRTTPYGNPYSSNSGKYTKEECVALHRVHLYGQLVQNPGYLAELNTAMIDKDLVCWCAHEKYHKACHGRNYLHLFDPELAERTYTKSVTDYLMEDLRLVLKRLSKRLGHEPALQDNWIKLYFAQAESKFDIYDLLETIHNRQPYREVTHAILSYITIDLECALAETDPKMIEYRIDHMSWQCHRWMDARSDRDGEPHSPQSPLKRKKKK